jgi:hypothetical protein
MPIFVDVHHVVLQVLGNDFFFTAGLVDKAWLNGPENTINLTNSANIAELR